ncbi:MAG TPA: ROK family transcriptional regulator, partial [Nocardioides sp.]|nr:ROK family transcriptional regulator [Nocardioides sp.]
MARGTGLGHEELRRNNMSQLLTRVHLSGPTSRAELTRELGLNRSTIGDLAGSLAALGLISEGESVLGARSGRPSLLVSPRTENVV